MIQPEHVIPSHGNLVTHGSYLMMAEETGLFPGIQHSSGAKRSGAFDGLREAEMKKMEGELEAELKSRALRVTEAIEKLVPLEHPRPLYQASRHLVDAGGKRLRPAMLSAGRRREEIPPC